MVAVCCYFQVHQPFRLRTGFNYFAIGTADAHEDLATNAMIMRKVAEKCYLPANAVLLDLIRKHEGRFKVAFSISGVALEQFELYAPKVLDSFRELARTGCVEFLAETYYHSLAYVFSEQEFVRQVRMHQKKLKETLGVSTKVFRNTELIYDDRLGCLAEKLGFHAVLAEGADHVLDWRSPNYVYRPKGTTNIALLLKNYRLSDDIAFRFSDKGWAEWPLTAGKYADWLHRIAGAGDVVNLFMDYETFGEHQWENTGIFAFLQHLPAAILRHPDFCFMTPSEVAKAHVPVGEISFPRLTSWADTERDLSAWLGNHMQDAAAAAIFGMEKDVLATGDKLLAHEWRKLTTSDHFYYMCTKFFQDGDVHKYFSPYESPYDAFIVFANAMNQLKHLTIAARQRRTDARRVTREQRSVRSVAPIPGQAPRTIQASAGPATQLRLIHR